MEEKTSGLKYDRVFRALGDPHRIFILDLLTQREMNAGELLERVDVVQSTLSHHMKSLCESGLVIAQRRGKWTYYAVCKETAEQAREFLKRYLEKKPEEASASDLLESISDKTEVIREEIVMEKPETASKKKDKKKKKHSGKKASDHKKNEGKKKDFSKKTKKEIKRNKENKKWQREKI